MPWVLQARLMGAPGNFSHTFLLLFRMSEHLTLQETQEADTLGMLHALGAAGQADGRIALHSVLTGGKRRITAELAHSSEQEGGQPMLQLQRVRQQFLQLQLWLQTAVHSLHATADQALLSLLIMPCAIMPSCVAAATSAKLALCSIAMC
jgi:hypothetical protein